MSPPTTHNENNRDDESLSLEITTSPTSVALTPSPSTSEDASTEISQPQGRNIQFPSPYEDVVVLAPIQDNLDSPYYRNQIVGFEQPVPPYALGYDDAVDVVPTQYEPSMPGLRNRLVYPVERFREDDMAAAESNIVFRPLFTYRRQTAQKRRIYTQPSYSSSSSSSSPPSSSSYGNTQRRRQGYRYPSYYGGYPSYYVNAQYDYVP
ncbi:hypothetical protein ILUMI_19335 [Ignelater luminosus]|uniref:Uncharacterized protein n=1 Tax=Ignelater luminosus TaxID=2038154 RepID=A0A8K0CGD9_IGNLU|nr:hypothetical protein ILUMI_19335 [Ignelater luminosus]